MRNAKTMKPVYHTPVPLPDYSFEIGYEHKMMSLGSCFVEHIGGRLKTLQFQQILNPFGIVYHPLVLASLLNKLLSKQNIAEADLFQQQELWRHYDFHSRFAHPDQTTAFEVMHQQFEQAVAYLPQLDYLFITLGTAFGYRLQSTNQWVNNCHKQDAKRFLKERADLGEIIAKLGEQLAALKEVAPNLSVIMTVSPVRHLRDGLLENQRSKAILLLAVDALVKQFPFVHYFPAYEIMLDELRDYRFYNRDMLHPSEVAVDHIWKCFQCCFFSKDTAGLTKQVESINRALRHNHQHPESAAVLQFEQQLQARIKKLEEKYD
ncbi:MAG: GSCFA domain-containing protein, partial [Bacteroidota bacterium]